MKFKTNDEFREYMNKKIIHDEEILKVYEEVSDKLIKIGVPLKLNKIKKVGAYKTNSICTGGITYSRTSFDKFIIKESYIGINKKLNIKKQDVVQTMAHELIHTIDGCANHGKNFKYYASMVNKYYPEYNISRCSESNEEDIENIKNEAKYIIVCPKCGHKCYYMRNCQAVREPYRYHCNKCSSGGLKVEKVN